MILCKWLRLSVYVLSQLLNLWLYNQYIKIIVNMNNAYKKYLEYDMINKVLIQVSLVFLASDAIFLLTLSGTILLSSFIWWLPEWLSSRHMDLILCLHHSGSHFGTPHSFLRRFVSAFTPGIPQPPLSWHKRIKLENSNVRGKGS